MYRVVTTLISVWIALNFLIPALIIYAAFPASAVRWMTSTVAYPRTRELAHVLVYAARHHR
jgi:hypothetical protein